jgi:hypothetical protein
MTRLRTKPAASLAVSSAMAGALAISTFALAGTHFPHRSTEATVRSTHSADIRSWRLSKNGLGALRVGLTVDQIESRSGFAMKPGYGRRSCRTWSLAGAPPGLGLMTAYGRLVRVDVFSKVWKSARGVRVGMRGSAVRRRYPNLRVERHPYTAAGRYLVVGGGKRRMIFETGAHGRVTSFRGGRSKPVGYIEGCA